MSEEQSEESQQQTKEDKLYQIKVIKERAKNRLLRYKNYHKLNDLPLDQKKILVMQKEVEQQKKLYWECKGRKCDNIVDYRKNYNKKIVVGKGV